MFIICDFFSFFFYQIWQQWLVQESLVMRLLILYIFLNNFFNYLHFCLFGCIYVGFIYICHSFFCILYYKCLDNNASSAILHLLLLSEEENCLSCGNVSFPRWALTSFKMYNIKCIYFSNNILIWRIQILFIVEILSFDSNWSNGNYKYNIYRGKMVKNIN